MSETNETNETPKPSKTPQGDFTLSETMLRAFKWLETGEEWRDLLRALLNYYFAEKEPPQEIEKRARFAFYFLKQEIDDAKARKKQLSEIRRAASLKARERERELREQAGKAEKTRELGRERLRKFRKNQAAQAQAQEQTPQGKTSQAPRAPRAPKTAEEIEAKKEARRIRERDRQRRKRAEAKAQKAREA